MSEAAGKKPSKQEQFDEFMKGFTIMRLPESAPWYQPRADVIFMLGQCFRSVRIACQHQDWPELFSAMKKVSNKDETDLMESIRLAHCAWVDLLDWIDNSENRGIQDNNYKEALTRVGWDKIPLEGRIIAMTQLGLYFLSRIWICGRQRVLSDMVDLDNHALVAAGVTEGFRCVDQSVSPVINASKVLKNAVLNATQQGMTPEQILSAVNSAISSGDASSFSQASLMEVVDAPPRSGN